MGAPNTNYEQANGTVFFDPNIRQFIQVRENYFNINRDYKGFLHTGSFATYLDDAKNDLPRNSITIYDVRKMINVEEVGLKNIKHVVKDSSGYWKGEEKLSCPHCHRPY